jgi:hypothetical protein
MTVRLFDWRDLPAIHRYRQDCVFLDSALVLTRGPLLVERALFSSFAPSMVGVFTCVVDGERINNEPRIGQSSNGQSAIGHPNIGHPMFGQPIIGQFMHLWDSPFSYLTFLAPQSALESPRVSALIEYMTTLSGERGALRLLADVDERTQVFEILHKCGFAIYTRQRVWQITSTLPGNPPANNWRAATSRDVIPIRSLYNNLVPALVQQAEPFSSRPPNGLVCYQKDELLAYVELQRGRRGIWAHPFVHPDAENVPERFIDLLSKIPGRKTRPMYFCVRSYQSWLEPVIEELGAEAGLRQAVMMKQLATPQKVARPFALPALEKGKPEITAPAAHLESE